MENENGSRRPSNVLIDIRVEVSKGGRLGLRASDSTYLHTTSLSIVGRPE